MSNEELPNPLFKRVLNRCRESLRDDMDFDSMCDYLISKEVLTTRRLKDIKEEKYTSEKNLKLTEAIATAGPEAYKVFRNGLKDTKQRHLYDLLRKEEKALAKESKEKKTSDQGHQPVKATTSDNAAQMVTEASKTLHSRVVANVTKDIESLPGDLGRVNLHSGDNTQQATSPTTTLKVSENAQRSASTPSNDSQSFASSQLFGGNSKPSETRSSNVCGGPTVVPAGTADNITGQHQTTQQTDNLQNRSGEQPISFGNLTSYKDMHGTDRTEDLTSSLKQEHYAGGATNQQQMTTHNDESRRDQTCPGTGEQGTGANGVQSNTGSAQHGGGAAGGRDAPTPVVALLLVPDIIPTQGSTSGQAAVSSPGMSQPTQGFSDAPRDDPNYLQEHFDACVIYTEGNRNRAEEVIEFIGRFPENFKAISFDDEEYFGMFTPESQASVIPDHCVLLLIIITGNVEEDKHAEYLRKTVSMALKNSALVRPVVFLKEEKKIIPNSLANKTPINWYDKDQDFFRKNLLALLKQCKALRIKRNVKTKKDIV